MPDMPMALPPLSSSSFTSVLFTLPARTICTMSTVSASVTRRPSTNSAFLPRRFIMSLISGPPPCTSTTFTPTSHSRTMSSITCCRSSSLTMALPPYFTTTIFPLYLRI